MVVDNNNDLVPTNFVIKIFETKELAEANVDNNALKVFNNGIDGGATDPRVANGSQYMDGNTSGDGRTPNTIIDSAAKFGNRLVGKEIVETTSSPVVVYTIDSFVDENTLGLLLKSSGAAQGIDTGKDYHVKNPGAFFIFHKYYYRIESTDPVKGFVIDWDDGEDNSPEKANRQTIMLDTPKYYAIVAHTYTHHGVHYPMIRTISPEGFYSKWYVSHDAVVADSLRSIETQLLGAGENDFSIVSADLTQTSGVLCRIPEIAPANMPPVGVLKVDRTSVYSGIDNSAIPAPQTDLEVGGGAYNNETEISHTQSALVVVDMVVEGSGIPNDSRISSKTDLTKFQLSRTTTGGAKTSQTLTFNMKPKGYAYVYRSGNTLTGMTGGVEVIYRTSTDRIIKEAINPHSTAANATAFPSAAADGYLKEILSVKLVELREGTITSTDRLGPDERIFIKVYNSATDGSTTAAANSTTDETVTIVSLGNPIQTLDRPGFSIFAEGSQSQTRASNVSISKYWFEDGKLSGTTRQGPSLPNISDAFDATDDFDQTDSGTRIHYTFDPKSNVIDATLKSFPDEERLIRLQVEDSSATTKNDVTSGLLGRSGDSCVKSFIEHWTRDSYKDDLCRPSSLFSDALLMFGNVTTGGAVEGATYWTERIAENAINTGTARDTTGSPALSADTNGDPFLVFGGSKHSAGVAASNETQLSGIQTGDTGGEDDNPTNWLFCAKDEKFNKLHIRMDNDFQDTAALGGGDTDWFNISHADGHKVNIMAWYTAKASRTSSTYIWKPISIVDGTSLGDFNTSLMRSGTIYFDMPDDWVQAKSSDLGDPWAGPVDGDTDSVATDPKALWLNDLYGLLIGISINETNANTAKWKYWRCNQVWPYNNSFSQAIKIVDPHHKSLNDIAFAQNISWSKAGKYIEITDRLGRAEVRRIGAEGGTLSFGGVELSGDYTTNKAALSRYQRKGTPVYLDVERANGDFIRVYGVINSMSEDYPTGKALPKFGLNMKVEYVVEYDSSGDWITSGLMALGGEIIDEPKYIL